MREKWLWFAVSSGAPSFSATQAMSGSIVASGVPCRRRLACTPSYVCASRSSGSTTGSFPMTVMSRRRSRRGSGVELGADEELSPHEVAHGYTLGGLHVRLHDCGGRVGAVAGTASAALDRADMGTGGKEWDPVDAGVDLRSLGTIPFGRLAANANRTARYLSPVDSFWGVGGLGDIFLGGWDQ